MKQFIALFLISTLVVSASAGFNIKSVAKLFAGFTVGMNYTELNPTLEGCADAVNNTAFYAVQVTLASQEKNSPAWAANMTLFGRSFANIIKECAKSARLGKYLVETVGQDVKNISLDSLMGRIMKNMIVYMDKGKELKADIAAEDYYKAGKDIAALFKTFLLDGGDFLPKRLLAEVDVELFSSSANITQFTSGFTNFLLGVQGFLEEANTTIVVEHFTRLVNDSTAVFEQIPIVMDGLQNNNFSAVISGLTNLYKTLPVVREDGKVFESESDAFLQRDLALFDSQEKIMKAAQALMMNMPATFTNIQRVMNAMKNADYREAGKGTGALYNQLRNGALAN